MSVSYALNTVTINGGLANGEATVTVSQTLVRTTGDVPAASWVGRLIAFKPSSSESTNTQVRLVTAVSGNNVTVHDPWRNLGSLSGNFVIAHNLQDVHNIGDTSLKKIGDSTYQWDGEWNVTNNGFLGDLDISLEMRATSPSFTVESGCVVQFGLLWGGEKNDSVETTNGCSVYFNKIVGGTSSYYRGGNSRNENGAVINYYGSIIQSKNPNPSNWSFQRMQGPMRFIGCSFDGPMGGRFYHEATEWAQCRMSGNDDAVPAWSLGATFVRPVSDVIFFQNGTVMKNFNFFQGTFRDCVFTDSNGDIFQDSGSGQINFIDCTTFATTSGDAHQFKSVNFITTDDGGSAIADVAVRINAANDSSPTPVVSNASGVVPEILAEFQEANTSFGPFRIRIRKFGLIWSSLSSPIADAIKQSVSLRADANVTQSEAVALAHTDITLTDHGGSPVSWNGKSWGITVTANSSNSVTDLKHYLHAVLGRTNAIGGKASGLNWHNMLPMNLAETERGNYGGTQKGVRVIDENGEPFAGIVRMQADDGTYYTPPVSYELSFTGLRADSEVRAYTGTDPATSVEIGGVENSGTTFTFNHTSGGADGYVVVAALGRQNLFIPITYASANQSIPVQQNVDRQYNNPE